MSLLEHATWVDAREKPEDRKEYLDTLALRAAGVAMQTSIEVQTHFMHEKDDTGSNRFPFMG